MGQAAPVRPGEPGLFGLFGRSGDVWGLVRGLDFKVMLIGEADLLIILVGVSFISFWTLSEK